jgi:TctA family transporter
MLAQEERTLALSVWAALVSVIAIYFLTSNFWKAALIGAFVGVSSLLGYGTRWVLRGSFAIAVLAIAVALGLPPPDQWLQLINEVREAVFAPRTTG